MICEVCERYEATTKDYRADGEKWRSCQWCANLSTKNWYYIMHHRYEDKKVDPKTFYEEEE